MGLLVGYENEKKEILQLKRMLQKAEAYRACGIRIPRGLVLYGEPGVGKTQLAKTIVGDGITMVELRSASCCEENTKEEIQKVFKKAKEQQPSVVLLDELDKIAGMSEMYFMEDNSKIHKMLLQELDKLSDDDTVLVIATCNDTDVLGGALLRSGRFDRQLHVEAPDESTREQILRAYFDKLTIRKRLDYAYLSRITPGYTGAKLECLVNEVGIRVMEDDKKAITISDVRAVMNKLAFNGFEKMQIRDKEKLRMIATHEAGHAVVAMVLAPNSIFGASVLPQGQCNGHIHFVPPEGGVCTVKDVENEVAVLLGGHVAERVVLGEYLVGAGNDLQAAGARLNFLTVGQAAYGYENLGSFSPRERMMRDEASKEATNKVIAEKFNMLDSKVEDIIKKNRKVFDKIVGELLRKQTLSREELVSIKAEYCLSEQTEAPVRDSSFSPQDPTLVNLDKSA